VDGGYEDLTEDWFIRVFIVGYFIAPSSPFVFLYAPEIVIAEASFREFDFNQGSKGTVEFIEDLVIILTTTNTTTISPHCCKHEECFIDYLLFLLLLF
jgi:hypothetical protein